MTNLELLTKAIQEKRKISFEYNKPGQTQGVRIGDPYAIFIYTAKNTRIQSTKVHIVQTGGDSNSKEEHPFPSFRMYNIEDISNLELLEDSYEPVNKDYNPDWDGYSDVIIKV